MERMIVDPAPVGPSDANVAPESFVPETDLERELCAQPEWQAGAAWGIVRPGHPEGRVADHIAEVLENVDLQAVSAVQREQLRLIAILHDTFAYQVDRRAPRRPPNEHGACAVRFGARFVRDRAVLRVTELHDDAYRAWRTGAIEGDWVGAAARADRLVRRLGPSLELYLRFFRCDNRTGSKGPDAVRWFEGFLAARGHPVPPDPFVDDPGEDG